MPDCDTISNEDFSNYCCIGGDKDGAFVVNIEIVEVHHVAGSAESLTVFARGRDALLRREEPKQPFGEHDCE